MVSPGRKLGRRIGEKLPTGDLTSTELFVGSIVFLIGGFYPLTQIYQHKQDLDDGVKTISYLLGYTGTFRFCALIYLLAWAFMAQFFVSTNQADRLLLVSIFFIPVIVYFCWWYMAVSRDRSAANFRNTMKMNWLAAACTNTAFIILLIWNYFE